MLTPEDHIAQELRSELEARISSWKRERAELLKAADRISQLDALIAIAEADTTTVKIAPRPRPQAQPVAMPTGVNNAKA